MNLTKLSGCVWQWAPMETWHTVSSSMFCPLTLPDNPKVRSTLAQRAPNQLFNPLIPNYEWTVRNHQTFEENL